MPVLAANRNSENCQILMVFSSLSAAKFTIFMLLATSVMDFLEKSRLIPEQVSIIKMISWIPIKH